MSGRGRPSLQKRLREQARQQRKQEKSVRRDERRAEKDTQVADGEDPDLAGIVPGPQAQPWMEFGTFEVEDPSGSSDKND